MLDEDTPHIADVCRRLYWFDINRRKYRPETYVGGSETGDVIRGMPRWIARRTGVAVGDVGWYVSKLGHNEPFEATHRYADRPTTGDSPAGIVIPDITAPAQRISEHFRDPARVRELLGQLWDEEPVAAAEMGVPNPRGDYWTTRTLALAALAILQHIDALLSHVDASDPNAPKPHVDDDFIAYANVCAARAIGLAHLAADDERPAYLADAEKIIMAVVGWRRGIFVQHLREPLRRVVECTIPTFAAVAERHADPLLKNWGLTRDQIRQELRRLLEKSPNDAPWVLKHLHDWLCRLGLLEQPGRKAAAPPKRGRKVSDGSKAADALILAMIEDGKIEVGGGNWGWILARYNERRAKRMCEEPDETPPSEFRNKNALRTRVLRLKKAAGTPISAHN